MESTFIKNTIQIKASVAEVWDALTNAEKTKIYMFGCETISDWKVGSSLNWQGNYEGKDIVFVTGKIISIDEPHQLTYSTFDPNSEMEDIPENHLNVTYTLTEDNGITTLDVSQGDYATVAEGERRFKEASNNGEGWQPILIEIKKLVEGN